ncbi:MAG: type II secretion system F family protein [Candidatus Omnitrophota bacterium]|nr:type II secretion system F family protein [Candidatus Omnitrophota bacterium]
MAMYRYKARDQSGKLVEGTMEAPSQGELADKLRKMGYIVTGVALTSATVSLEDLVLGFRRIKPEDMIFFNIQLSNMLDAGLPLLTCLRTISIQMENRRLKKVLEDVTLKVETGTSFSEALQSHSRHFSKLTISMVRAGEASGNLALVLKRLADFGERELDLRNSVSSALLYPAILLFAATAVIIFIVTFIIPKFVEIFSRAGIPLPLVTTILNAVGIAIKDYWYLFILGIIAFLLAARLYVNTKDGRLKFDGLKLSIPVTGPLIRKVAISRFARTLATLSASGVPILESLEIMEGTIGNEVLARVIATLREAVRGGSKISEPLKISEEFPPDIVQMVAAGEETGNLDGMLNKVADLYDSAVAYSIKRLTSLLEPIFLVIMGCVVAVIMASILVPMFDLVKVLKR